MKKAPRSLSFDYIEAYQSLHKNAKHFAGRSIVDFLPQIIQLVDEMKPRSLLDYGCGKGYQYLRWRVHERWGGLLPYCYDVGIPQLRVLPSEKVDGVICTDVMEHIAEPDISIVLGDIFGCVERSENSFAFFGIETSPSRKHFSKSGDNIHKTVKDPEWWEGQFLPFKRKVGRLVLAFSQNPYPIK